MLAIFIVVAYGVLPLLSAIPIPGGFLLFVYLFRTLPLGGSIVLLYGPDGSAPFLPVLVSLFLSVFSVVSAIWAASGYSEGRVSTLILLTLNVLWWSALTIMAIMNGGFDTGTMIWLPIEFLLPIGWLTFVWWNFMRPDVTEYYRYRSTLQNE